MRNREIAAVAVPTFIAEVVVVVSLFLGATVIINGRTLWAVIVGLAP
jgi:hypothetical protein